MTTDPAQCWKAELEYALRRKSRPWMCGPLRPRIAILPRLWGGYGSWTLFTWIFITQKQLLCPEHVRRYLICHELAHVWAGHVYLQALFAGSYLVLMSVSVSHPIMQGVALVLTIISYVIFVTPRLSLARECAADSIAVELNGAYPTLLSSLWMAQRARDVHTPQRQARLRRLRHLVWITGQRDKDWR